MLDLSEANCTKSFCNHSRASAMYWKGESTCFQHVGDEQLPQSKPQLHPEDRCEKKFGQSGTLATRACDRIRGDQGIRTLAVSLNAATLSVLPSLFQHVWTCRAPVCIPCKLKDSKGFEAFHSSNQLAAKVLVLPIFPSMFSPTSHERQPARDK